jgi:alkylhydroperoxidase family enzyme
VEKVTLKPWTVVPEDLAALRDAGFEDRGILQINLIASAFAWLNRAADGLGVGKGPG